MRSDEVRGGTNAFNGRDVAEGDNQRNVEAAAGETLPISNGSSPSAPKATAEKRNGLLTNGVGRRKIWNSDQSSAGGSAAHISRPRSDQLSVNEKSPGIQAKKGVVTERNPILGRKRNLRSGPTRSLPESRKVKSDSGKIEAGDAVGASNSTSTSRAHLRKTKSELETPVDEVAESVETSESPGEVKSGSDGICMEMEVYGAKTDATSSDQNRELPRIQSGETNETDEDDEYSEDEEEEEEILNEEIGVKSSENNTQEIPVAKTETPHQEPGQTAVGGRKQSVAIEKPNPISAGLNKQRQINEKPKPINISTNAIRPAAPPPPPSETIRHNITTSNSANRTCKNIRSPNSSKFMSSRTSAVHGNYVKPTSYGYQSCPETQNKLQNLVDLVMWRDVSRSAFVFGIGAFTIISSSYTKDLDISFITVISYLGLVYLGTIFLYRSIICRGYAYIQHTGAVLREDEAIRLLKLVLPYLNEFLLKIRTLFSGDPATTMKLAVLLFLMARCGSSITIWKMAKLATLGRELLTIVHREESSNYGFLGAFTVPKVCSSYSTQISAYGKFWVRRIRDAWDSCSHKKAVAVAIFTLFWNLSSVIARIWAAFMLFVAFRYYQQSLVTIEDDGENDAAGLAEATCQGRAVGARRGGGPETTKERKAS